MFLSHIDNFAVEKKYLAPRIQVALEFLRKTDWSSKADGKYVIDGDVIIANLATYTTKPKAECKAETHLKYIDIQYMVKGAEVMGYSPLLSGQEIAEDCSKEKDAIFYKNINNEQEVVVSEKMYTIFYPTDIHIPSCLVTTPQEIRKIVVKIAIEQ